MEEIKKKIEQEQSDRSTENGTLSEYKGYLVN